AYLLGVEQFAKHFQRSPDQLGLDHLRDYQVHLFRVRKIKPATVAVRLAALRFLFVAVLKRQWTVDDTPYPKRPDALPTVLSQDEVVRLINPHSAASRRSDDALYHRPPAGRVDPAQDQRHRHRTHGDPRSRRQGWVARTATSCSVPNSSRPSA